MRELLRNARIIRRTHGLGDAVAFVVGYPIALLIVEARLKMRRGGEEDQGKTRESSS